MKRLLIAGATIVLATSAYAQGQGQGQGQGDTSQPLTIFDKGHFKGARLQIYGPWQHITPAFTARSVQVPDGQSWELCSGNTFTGCKEFNQSVTATVADVRSARPVPSAIVSGSGGGALGTVSAATADVPDRSLKGLASEYFVAPQRAGSRITVQSGTGEAMRQAANDFCRSKGWRVSPYARLQKVGAIFYLADTLCADSDG